MKKDLVTYYEVRFYSNSKELVVGKYENYFEALNKMHRSAEHFAQYLKKKCFHVFTYNWPDNILVREEYDQGILGLSQDLFGKFELVESGEWV